MTHKSKITPARPPHLYFVTALGLPSKAHCRTASVNDTCLIY